MSRFHSILMLAFAAPLFAQNVTWVSMQENQEHSFSIDVPKGWKVAGGLIHVPGLGGGGRIGVGGGGERGRRNIDRKSVV